MVVSLAPEKFYGSGLPRPRFYTDVKLNSERVDPPEPVLAPLLSWADDAHWSMGGLSFQRHRLQGRIEGSIKKLRSQQDDRAAARLSISPSPQISTKSLLRSSSAEEAAVNSTLSELFHQRKRGKAAGPCASPAQSKRIRNLGDVFDRIAAEQKIEVGEAVVEAISSRTRSRKPALVEAAELPAEDVLEDNEEEDAAVATAADPCHRSRRTSPRKKSLV